MMRRMLFAIFVRNPSVDAVLPEQQPTVWSVLYWAKLKLEYWHTTQSTKNMIKGELFGKMHSERLAKLCAVKKKLRLVESENKL